MPFHYSSEFRHRACERMLAGAAVKELAAEISVSDGTLYKWRRQALIDAGRRAGTKSFEAHPLVRARSGDLGLGLVDALLVAIAERLKLTVVATLNHRDFNVVRPKHCAAFELLP